MGIRFQCHHCHYRLHVKDFQAGRRSKCPQCRSSFRIPRTSQLFSDPVEKPTLAAAAITQQEKSGVRNAPREFKENQETSRVRWQSLDSPGVKWIVKPPSGGEYGPADSNLIREWIREERVSRDSLIRQVDWSDWHRADALFLDAFPKDSENDSEPDRVRATEKVNAQCRSRISDQVKNRIRQNRRIRSQRQLVLTSVLALFALLLIFVLYLILTVKKTKRLRDTREAAASRHIIDQMSTTEVKSLVN